MENLSASLSTYQVIIMWGVMFKLIDSIKIWRTNVRLIEKHQQSQYSDCKTDQKL